MAASDDAELQLVAAFHRAYSSAKSSQARKRVLYKFCRQIQTSHRKLESDAQAITTVVRYSHGKDSDSNSDDDSPDEAWQLAKSLAARANAVATRDPRRQQRMAVKTVVALWSYEKVVHYGWDEASYRFLNSMIKVPRVAPTWDTFVRFTNCAMIARHEKSCNHAWTDRIGDHKSQSCVQEASSPVELSDLSAMLKENNKDWLALMESRVERWLSPCTCLAIDGKPVPDVQYHHRALTLDQFGMLIPLTERQRQLSCTYCNNGHVQKRPRSLSLCKSSSPCKERPRSSRSPPSLREKRTRIEPGPSSSPTSADAAPLPQLNTSSSGSSVSNQNIPQSPGHNSAACTGEDASEADYNTARFLDEGACLLATINGGQEGVLHTLTPDHSAFPNKTGSLKWRPDEQDANHVIESDHDHVQHPSTPFPCSACMGPCEKCVVPLDYSVARKEELCRVAHQVWSLDHLHPGLPPLISPIRYASMFEDCGNEQPSTSPEEADVWRLSAGSFERLAASNLCTFPGLTIIEDTFSDAYTAKSFADALSNKFVGMDILARIGEKLTTDKISVSKAVALLNGQASDTNVHNLLSMEPIVAAEEPRLTRLHRFSLLETVVSRLKARSNLSNYKNLADRQVKSTPYDVASRIRFNTLGFSGAFSGPHRDALGGTWLRSRFGTRLWGIVPENDMTEADWRDFENQGSSWNPGTVRKPEQSS